MKVLFAGSPYFAAFILQALLQAKFEVAAVLTQIDKPRGRGLKSQFNEVKSLALEHALPVLQFTSLQGEDVFQKLQSFQPDVMVVAAYGLLIPPHLLNLPTYGCVNVHASLLPRWRGAAPIQRAIEAGDQQTGICIMQMDEGLDTGEIILEQHLSIREGENALSLQKRLQELGAELIIQALRNLPHLERKPQSTVGVTYAHKISKKEALINWQLPALQLARKIAAFNPSPVVRTYWQGKLLKIWQAKAASLDGQYVPGEVLSSSNQGLLIATGEGGLWVQQLQLEGRNIQQAEAFIKGYPQILGSRVGQE